MDTTIPENAKPLFQSLSLRKLARALTDFGVENLELNQNSNAVNNNLRRNRVRKVGASLHFIFPSIAKVRCICIDNL
eukprot:5031635-Amphidinium_carterae.1